MHRRTLLILAIFLAVTTATIPVASAAQFSITDIATTPDQPPAGEEVTYTVHIQNDGTETVEFTQDSRLQLLIEGESRNTNDLLVDPNYTGPDQYLTIPPGETGTWDIAAVESGTGTKTVAATITGDYLYGGSTETADVSYSEDMEFTNPPVESLDLWLTRFDGGVKPSVIVANGKAYTGTLSLTITTDGAEAFSDTYQLRGTNRVTPVINDDQFYQGEGRYTFEISFEGKRAAQTFDVPPGSDTQVLYPVETTDVTETDGAADTPAPEPTATATATETATEAQASGGDSGEAPESTPGFLLPAAIGALLVALLAHRR